MKFSLNSILTKYGTLIFFSIAIVTLIFWYHTYDINDGVVKKQQDKKQEYVAEIKNLQGNIQYDRKYNQAKQLLTTKRLAKLYRDGVPDKYDINGKKIRGIAPDPNKAIRYYEESHQLGSPFGMLKVAKIFHYGMHNLEPNLEKAAMLYRKVMESSPKPQLRQKASELYRDLTNEIQKKNVHNWLNLPYNLPKSKRYEYKNVNRVNRVNRVPGQTPLMRAFSRDKDDVPAVNIDTVFRANSTQRRPVNVAEKDDEEETVPAHQRNDLHNVHDSGVLGTIRRSIQNLQEKTKVNISLPQSLREIRELLRGKAETDKQKDACLALDAVERSFLPLSSTDIREVDALHLVWNRIHDPINQDNKKALQENLIDELSECIEHDKPVCSTGRFTRILDTLNATDPAVQIKPMYALKDEMMGKCAAIRKDMLDSLPERERDFVNSTNENETQAHFETQLKNRIRKELQNDYVTKNVLTQQQLDSEVNKWIDFI